MKMEGKGFRVVIEGLDADRDQVAHLNSVVQTAVLTELARLDLFEGVAVAFPRDWIGLWLRQLDHGHLGELGYQR
jgi:hypothetical protein